MRLLYLDLDSLRPDHLGCYGYHRDTSPNIDRIAAEGVRFENCYATDVPCLPSRTALFAGRAGIHTGVINHGGVASQPFIEGRGRGFQDRFRQTSWPARLRQQKMYTATVSPFGERHSAWHWFAGFNEILNPVGKGGNESAEEVWPDVRDWIGRNAERDDWFLHVNFWDPHTPYRAPAELGNPFEDEPLPAWYSEEVRREHWANVGPHSAREVRGWDEMKGNWERKAYGEEAGGRQPYVIDSMEQARRMFDGYDCGVRWADEHVGRVLNALAEAGVLDDTAIMISADHGENLGELNIYGDHQTADHVTGRVPLIVRWPGVTDSQAGRADASLIHHYDWAATSVELCGGEAEASWDARPFTQAFRDGKDASVREAVVVSQGAWSAQRGVRFQHDAEAWMMIRSYHDGYHGFPDVMLFNLTDDPHEQHDLAADRPEVVGRAMTLLDRWLGEMMRTATTPRDPMWTVLHEGGAFHTRGRLPGYLKRLRATDRGGWADRLAAKHPQEAGAGGGR